MGFHGDLTNVFVSSSMNDPHTDLETRGDKLLCELGYSHAGTAMTILYNDAETNLHTSLITADNAYVQKPEEMKHLSNCRSLIIFSASTSSNAALKLFHIHSVDDISKYAIIHQN